MTPEQWKKVEDLFHSASELSDGERTSWLTHHCEDLEVREKVNAMLASDKQGGGVVVKQHLVRGLLDFHAAAPLLSRIHHIGPYKLVRELGRGGMGTVYLGERDDDQYEGRVAIKVVRPGLDTDFFLARFRRERQTLARLQHPNIARLLDSGTSEEGVPYIVMEYIDGQLITEYCQNRQLNVEEKIRLFLSVCAAVSHAHQHFVVHRDLKPGNILVDNNGVPKLLDFGVCKLLYRDTSATAVTRAEIILTPDYGSPEQVRGEPVTVASDIYSLGAVFYELLTDERVHKFEKLSPQHVEHVICETDITPPSAAVTDRALVRKLSGDIDNIIMRALQKEPQRRYESVEQFANDLRNHLEHRPVHARPDTLRYRVRKFARRNRGTLAASLAVAAALGGGIVASVREAQVARRHFSAARQLANAFVFDVHDQVKNLPGSVTARQTILNTGLKYLDSLASEARNDVDLRRELAAAYERIGEVQGHVLGSHTGAVEDGLSSYRKALSVLDGLPATRDVQIDRILLHDRLGDLQFGIGKTQDARNSYKQALEIAKDLSRTHPNDNLVRRHLANTYISIGRLERESQDWVSSLDHMSEGRRLLRDAMQVEPDVPEIRRSVAVAIAGMGTAQVGLGKLNEAKESFEGCVKEWDELVKRYPDHTHSRRQRMLAYGHLGDLLGNPNYSNLGDFQGARQALDTVVDIAGTLHNSDKADTGAWIDYGVALMHRAAIPGDSVPEQIARLQQARSVLFGAEKASPENVSPPMNIAALSEQIGDLLKKSGRTTAAVQEYKESLAKADQLIGTGRVSASRIAVMVSGKLAEEEARNGKASEALDHCRKAIEVGEKAAKTTNASATQQALALRAYATMGSVQQILGNREEARRWREKSLTGFRDLQQLAGFTDQLRRQMGEVERALRENLK